MSSWTEELFYQAIRFADKPKLLQKIIDPGLKDEKFQVKINHTYPLYKDLFGVPVEYGHLRLQKVLMKDALDILELFVSFERIKNRIVFFPKQNIDGIIELGIYLELEKPHRDSVQGYLINNELVKLEQEPETCIILKYKDSPENIFYIYRLSFLQYEDELFLVIEKNI